MRAFGPRALEALTLSSTSMSAASEMQFLAGDAQLRVCEVPIEIRYFGDTKRSLALEVVQTFDRTHILLVGQLIFAVAFVIVGVLSLFTAIVLNALQGLRQELRSRR
jgi:hypothetical protein